MKHLYLFLAAAALSLAACSDDEGGNGGNGGGNNGGGKPFDGEVISFEASEHLMDVNTGDDIQLGDVTMSLYGIGEYTYRNVFCAKPYAVGTDYDGPLFGTADQSIWFSAYYASAWDAWGGISVAQSPDRTEAEYTLKQQFSVWAEGGANGTKRYAVFYDSNSPSDDYPEYQSESGWPLIDFTEGPRTVDHLYIANSTAVYCYFKGADTDLFQVQITGYRDEAETGSVTETLVAGRTKLDGWRKVSLRSLGAVDRLKFKVVGIDVTSDPTFFCIDEIGLDRQ